MRTARPGWLERLRAATSRPRGAQALYWAGWCTPPLIARALMNLERGVSPDLADLRGVMSDTMVGLFGAWLGLLALRAFEGRIAQAAVAGAALVAALFHYAGFEHVLALDAPIDITLIGYLGDETFVAGSSAMIEHPLVLAALVVLVPLAAYHSVRRLQPARPRLGPTTGALVASLLLTRVWSPSLTEQAWRQSHFFEMAPGRVLGPGTSGSVDCNDPEIKRVFQPELDAERRVAIPPQRPNVLLIMVEGMTGAYVPAIAQAHGLDYHLDMSRVSERVRERGLYFSSFVNHQRQTNRGEYTLLCGEYPKLSSETPKMSDYVIEPGRPCLPAVLRDAGYHTAYLQAANLSFMMKDRFMALAGFVDVRGEESFPGGHARSGWGIDDRGLFEGVLEQLTDYEKEGKPWFAAVLTVGTHAPFAVPEDFPRVADEPDNERAFRYADLALEELLAGLERSGLAENTLVLITSDESAGIVGEDHDPFSQLLSKNWGVMLALGPGIVPEHERAHFAQSDLAISVLDYLGLADGDTPFAGRSYFRRYASGRRLGFANAYTQMQFSLDPEGRLTACPETSDECVGYQLDPGRIFAEDRVVRSPEPDEVAFLRGLVARSEVTPASLLRASDEPQEFPLVNPVAGLVTLEARGEKTEILAGQAIRVPPGHRYHVELRYRAIGPGVEVFADNDLRTRLEVVRFQPWGDPIREGEIVNLEYDYVPDELVYDVDVSLRAFKQSKGEGGAILVEKALARLEPLPDAGAAQIGFSVSEFSVTRRSGKVEPLPYHRVTLESARFWRNRCIKDNGGKKGARWRGRACREGEILRGPGSSASPQSVVKTRVVLVASQGSGRGHIELRASRGLEKHGDLSEWGEVRRFRLEPEQRVELEFEHTMREHHRDVGLVLVLDDAPGLDFEIEALEFEVVPPASEVRWPADAERG